MAISTYSNEKLSGTSIVYRSKISQSSKVIYQLSLLVVLLILLALPLIKTPISVKGTGMIQSALEKTVLSIPINGRLIKYQLSDNKKVREGDVLLVIDAGLPFQQSAIVQSREIQLRQFLADISMLLSFRNLERTNSPQLQTGQYNASWQQFLQELENAGIAKRQAASTYARYYKLYQNEAITTAEYEKYKFEVEQSESADLMIRTKYKSRWQTEASEFRNELRQLSGQQAELHEQKKQYIIKAPVNGSVQNLIGLQNGAYVFENQKIAEISPDGNLLAFCYLKPADIGLIKKGQEVRFQVDAYNYNQWGLALGKVLDIADDIMILNGNQAVFKVKCSLSQDHLKLKNGYKGYLKKGMNFTARFSITNRTLYQLLYDQLDDWLNPNLKESTI